MSETPFDRVIRTGKEDIARVAAASVAPVPFVRPMSTGDRKGEAQVGILFPYSPDDYAIELAMGDRVTYRFTRDDAEALAKAIVKRLNQCGVCRVCNRDIRLGSEVWTERCDQDPTGSHRA